MARNIAGKRCIYQEVTEAIITELEKGAAPWVKPWKNGSKPKGGIMPANAVTGRSYSGINVPILWMAAEAKGYEQHRWMTFKQSLSAGGAVRKGEKGTTVVFTKKITVEEESDDNDNDKKSRDVAMLKTFTVFNVAQIDSLDEQPVLPAEPEIEPYPHLQQVGKFIAATGADIRYGGDRACYVPSRDLICMPPLSAFRSPEQFRATELHELAHWSGASQRLDRDLSGRFGSQSYAAEELVAELTTAFLCAHLGVIGELRHAGYIDSWLTLLRGDRRAIFTAASKASQAADYLRAFSEQETRNEAA